MAFCTTCRSLNDPNSIEFFGSSSSVDAVVRVTGLMPSTLYFYSIHSSSSTSAVRQGQLRFQSVKLYCRVITRKCCWNFDHATATDIVDAGATPPPTTTTTTTGTAGLSFPSLHLPPRSFTKISNDELTANALTACCSVICRGAVQFHNTPITGSLQAMSIAITWRRGYRYAGKLP